MFRSEPNDAVSDSARMTGNKADLHCEAGYKTFIFDLRETRCESGAIPVAVSLVKKQEAL